MSIYLIRHGDKAPGRFETPGLPLNDQPLSELGRQQALRLLDYFQGVEIESIGVSEYRRTAETIAPLAADRGLCPRVDGRLNEINVGEGDRLTDAELAERYPEFWEAYRKRDRDFRFPGGESGAEAASRGRSIFDSLDPSRNHLLISHDGLIRVLLCSILGLPPYRRHLFRIDTASVTELVYGEAQAVWAIQGMNRGPGEPRART